MSYNVAGSGMRSAVCRALMRRYGGDVVTRERVPATMVLETSDAFVEVDAPEPGASLGRPYLSLVGRVAEIRGEFPFDVSTVRFAEAEDRPTVTYRYELSRTNLVEMCAKGMFEPGFEVPDVIRDNDFELPCSVSCAALAPGRGGEPPVVFVDVDAESLTCGDDESGYDIDTYFEEAPGVSREAAAEASFVPEAMTLERAERLLDGPDAEPGAEARVEAEAGRPAEVEPAREPVVERAPEPASQPRRQAPRTPSAGSGLAAAQRATDEATRDAEDEAGLDLGDDYL